MRIIKTKAFLKEYNKKIKNKHLYLEIQKTKNIEELILDSLNLKSLILNPLSKIYKIEQKKGNLREIFTADINKKMRLYIKPLGEYPYNMEEIVELEFIKIDDKHYGEG